MTTGSSTQTGSKIAVKDLVIAALCIALTLVATAFINIRLPLAGNGGLIHLGNVPLFLAAIIFGRKIGFLAGAFGMGMFDLISGWTAWAPFTFIIVGLMGFAVGTISEKMREKPYLGNLIAIIVALIIKIVGYYFAEVILFHNWIAPLGSIPGNILQITVAGIIVLPIAETIRKAVDRM